MVKDKNFIKESASIIDEIESQLQDVLEKRKKQVEKELEDKIRQEQEEAHKRISDLETQLKGDKEALISYKSVLSDFENNKERIKNEIKSHLDNAIQLQTEIEEKTGISLQELRTVSDLNKRLEEINQEASSKVQALKSELEDKYGIVAQVPETNGRDEVDIDLETELRKLQKIKELLGTSEPGERDWDRGKKKPGKTAALKTEGVAQAEESEKAEDVSGPAEKTDEELEETRVPEPDAELEKAVAETETEEEDERVAEAEESGEPSEEGATSFSEEIPRASAEEPIEIVLSSDLAEYKDDESVQKAFASLKRYRRVETIEGGGEVVFYEKNGKIILEGENLLAAINRCLEEAKQLYTKLSETDSPKEQFFIKQDIIKRQDGLRKVMLSNIRWSEKDTCSLPKFTEDVLNPDVLKSILEKVSMENWSNKGDFSSFDEYFQNLKDDYYKRLSPPSGYYDSIGDELKKN